MSTHQVHFARKFYQDKRTGYWISVDFPKIRAHRWVWNNHFGHIPKGYHIHHKDEDKSNNDISNLKLVHPKEHIRIHFTLERRKKAQEMAEKNRHLTKAWHQSLEGRVWHKLHAIKQKFGKFPKMSYECLVCKTKFESSKLSNTKFCSNICKSQWRRDQKIDDIKGSCYICSKEFSHNKYQKKITCGRACAAKYRWRDKSCTKSK